MKYLDEIIKYYVSHAREAIQNDRDRVWSSCSLEYDKLGKKLGNNEELLVSSSIINKETALHEEFFDYLWKKYDGDPFRHLQ